MNPPADIESQPADAADVSDRSWHWVSRADTADRLELSIWALAETLIAVGIYTWVALEGYVFHLVTAMCVAPFLLLRTPQSVDQSLRTSPKLLDHGEKLVDKIENAAPDGTLPDKLCIIILFIYVSILLFGLKVYTTITVAFKFPLTVVREIPKNWWRIVGCMDTWHPPEVLPGYIANKEKYDKWDTIFVAPIEDIRDEFFQWPDSLDQMAIQFIAVPAAFIVFVVPSIAYRWSLKGSCLIYLPILWLVHTATGGTARERFADLCKLSFYRFRRWFGVAVIIVVASKIFAASIWQDLNETISKYDTSHFLSLYLAPLEIPIWQLASAVNAILAWLTLFIAETALQRASKGAQISGASIVTVRALWFIGGVLTVYTVMCLAYNVITLEWDLIPIGNRLFPW